MKFPLPSKESNTCPTQMGRFTEKRPAQAGRSSRSYGRVPCDVSFDRELSNGAVRAYAIMALRVFDGNATTIGMRYLGQVAGSSKSTAERWVKELEKRGHIERRRAANGGRNVYILTSPVFRVSTVSRPTVDHPAENGPVDIVSTPQLTENKRCPQCRRAVKSLGKSGFCRTCVSDANKIRLWEAAKAELGPDATEEQLAHHLNLRKITAGWRKVFRRQAA